MPDTHETYDIRELEQLVKKTAHPLKHHPIVEAIQKCAPGTAIKWGEYTDRKKAAREKAKVDQARRRDHRPEYWGAIRRTPDSDPQIWELYVGRKILKETPA